MELYSIYCCSDEESEKETKVKISSIYTIPPFLGYVITNIGKKKYEQSIAAIGKALNINTTALRSFIFQIEEFVEINQVCYANTYSMTILPSGDCTICEMLYYNKHFILGNIKEMNIEDIWNSKKALSLYSPSKEEIVVESTCSSCSMFDKCRKNLAKKICYVDIMKVHKHPDFPDPKCPQSQQMCNYIL